MRRIRARGIRVRIEEGRSGRCVRCLEPIRAGEGVLPICGRPTEARDRFSIQLSADMHLAPHGATWSIVNHSCEPNLAVDFASWQLVARRYVARFEELTWNYLTTEWELHSPFECRCGAALCVGVVRGFAHLTADEQRAMADIVSPFLRLREPGQGAVPRLLRAGS
jgi:hypothetical protein